MKFLLKPDLQVGLPGKERVSSVSVNGLRLTIDGVEFDFSPLAVGGYLPPEAYINITPARGGGSKQLSSRTLHPPSDSRHSDCLSRRD